MRVVSVSGTRGSGKTSIIKELVTILAREGKRSAVIVNEEGEVSYDPEFISSRRSTVEHIRGG